MKKVVGCFIIILIIIFVLIVYINNDDRRYINKLKKDVINNTDIENIRYINKYDNYYIVEDKNYIYLIDSKYEMLLKKDIDLIYENKNKYDIIFKDGYLMYFNDYIKNDELIYEYYDINTYELINRVFVGGS